MNRKGFTLIELLVAVTLFLVAVGSFNYILKYGSVSVTSAKRLSYAAYTLQTQMEQVRSTPFNQLLALNACTFGEGKGKITVIPVMVDLVNIQLELDWDPNKAPLKIHTLRSKY